MRTFGIEGFAKNVLLLKQDNSSVLSFEKKKENTRKVSGFEGFGETENIRTCFYCFDCEHLFYNLTVLPKIYQNVSFGSFLHLLTLDQPSKIDAEVKGEDWSKRLSQSLFDMMVKSKSEKTETRCFHLRMTRIFVQNSLALTFEKYKLKMFKLLSNKDLKSKKVDNVLDFYFLSNLKKNFGCLLAFFSRLLKLLEDFLVEEKQDVVFKENTTALNKAFAGISEISVQGKIVLAAKSQKDYDHNFYFCVDTFEKKLKHLRELLDNTKFKLPQEFSLSQSEEILRFISHRRSERKTEFFFTGLGLKKRITEIQSFTLIPFQTDLRIELPLDQTSSFTVKTQKNTEKEEEMIPEKISVAISGKTRPAMYFGGKGKFRHATGVTNFYARFLSLFGLSDESFVSTQPGIDKRENARKKELTGQDLEMVDLRVVDFAMTIEEEGQVSRVAVFDPLEFCLKFKNYFQLKLPAPEKLISKAHVKEYFPANFEILRQKYKISLEYFIHSLSSAMPLSTTGGKTGSAFFVTTDQKYVIKEIAGPEFKHFKKFGLDFINYMLENSTENSQSLICRIYGFFKVNKSKFVVMENLSYFVGNPTNRIFRYDLKGSERNRFARNVRVDQTLMDTNFLIDRNGDPVSLNVAKEKCFWETLKRDSLFLSQHNIIDYSLFVVLDATDEVCYVKIIDYLRDYDWLKLAEDEIKKLTGKNIPTITKPADYRTRFLANSKKYFIVHEHEKMKTECVLDLLPGMLK